MVPSDTAIGEVGQFAQALPLLSPSRGTLILKNFWFFVPRRIVDPNFESMISGYMQTPVGTNKIELYNQPNLMLQFSRFKSYLYQTYPEGDTSLQTLFDDSRIAQNLLPYLHYNRVDNQGSISFPEESIEFAPILAFWRVFFDYFVDENIGYPLPQTEYGFFFIRDNQGSFVAIDRIFSYDQLLDLQFGFIGGAKSSLGDFLELGGNINPNGVGKPELNTLTFLLTLPQITWSKDYFTSALPWAQKGQPVSVPVSGEFDVSVGNVSFTSNIPNGTYNVGLSQSGGIGQLKATDQLMPNNQAYNLTGQVKGQVVSPTSQAGILINDLRTSIKMQEWLERNSRCGNRYIEMLRAHFGVRSSDARLQRPEFLGGGKVAMQSSEVLQTSATQSGNTPLATPAGIMTGFNKSRKFKYFAEEYGFLINVSFLTPSAFYSQGADRRMKRSHFYDFYFPEFAHLGEQEILTSELYNGGSDTDTTFGYQSRYAEYKHRRNSLCGEFLSRDYGWQSWLFGNREFVSPPTLSPSFLEVDSTKQTSLLSPFPNISNVGDHFIVDNYIKLKMIRPMPKYGVPYM